MIDITQRVAAEYESNDPEKILSEMGVKIFTVKVEGNDGILGMYHKIHGIPMVFVADDIPEPQRNFVLAHELGHIVLHHNINRMFLDRKTMLKSCIYEREADLFAACLLYPDPTEIIGDGDTYEKIACKMGVTEKIAEAYCKQHGIK